MSENLKTATTFIEQGRILLVVLTYQILILIIGWNGICKLNLLKHKDVFAFAWTFFNVSIQLKVFF
jgi:hypothetical protein